VGWSATSHEHGPVNVKVFVVLGNNGHHAAMMAPVMRDLVARGHAVDVLSVAELRGLPAVTRDGLGIEGVHVHSLFPRGVRQRLRRSRLGASKVGEASSGLKRTVAREVLWRTTMAPALRWHMMWLPDVVVLPNDVAFPYDRIRAAAQKRGVKTVLVQEGIRFPIPTEQRAGTPYGTGGCTRVCAWGEESLEHFASAGAPRDSLVATGNPRFDDVDVDALRAAAPATRERFALAERTLLYLSNPIDDQGFTDTDGKMRLFADFLARAAPVLADADAHIAVKLHAREDAAAFKAACARSPAPTRVKVIEDAPLHALLAAGRAAVVLSSTVGLEALLFGLPLGVVALPGYGPVHDYVRAGAAERLDIDEHLPIRLRALLLTHDAAAQEAVRAAYVDRHLAHRGQASARIADVITSVVGAGRTAA
jgi:hypothetical protein